MADKQDWYFTFGAGQPHDGKYVVVKMSTAWDARVKMVAKYGIRWSGQYSVPEFMRLGLNDRMSLLEEID